MGNNEPLSFPWKDLLIWYREHGRHHLPWRQYDDRYEMLYRVWLSEILLQQTQVDRVIPYLERILDRYPTIEDLGGASYEEFFPYYQGMGYYSRARNILKTASIITREYGGIFPREKSLLMKLPGVGPYTASAILAFGYGVAHLAWDTNLEKVFARYYHGRKDLRLSEAEKQEIEEDFQKLIIENERDLGPEQGGKQEKSALFNHTIQDHHSRVLGIAMTKPEIVRSINNALMDFASLVDLKNPDSIDWEKYPIRSGYFYETRGGLEPHEVKSSLTFPTPDATVIVILHKDHKIYYSEKVGGNSEQKYILSSLMIKPGTLNGYSPFILPPYLSRDTRKYVQDIFREKYGLELSVRPVHKKWISEDGTPYAVVNAQIQVGVHGFSEYTKTEAKSVIDSL